MVIEFRTNVSVMLKRPAFSNDKKKTAIKPQSQT